MLEKHDAKRSRTARANGLTPSAKPTPGSSSAKPTANTTSSGKTTGTGKTPAVAPFGLKLQRYFTAPGDDGFANIEWELRTAAITGENGKMVFEQRDVEVPKSWSQTATNVVVQKYFRGIVGTPSRERSVRQLISRVADTITNWGTKDGYFADDESARVFNAELKHLLVQQKMSFNSPVWFNVGIEAEPQCSACFINSVEDTMGSILTLAKTEGMLFKYGSGTGTNLSPIRSSKELLNGGGTASGPVSFMRGFDAFAGVIKSGGKTRRAAKMVILNIDHPDVDEFIWCKSKEEKKAWTLIDAGYDGSFDGEAYKSVFFQNSNNSVRVTDDFMEAVQKDRDWVLRSPRDGSAVETVKARDLWRDIATAAWECGDPGLQYDTTVNAWHTSSATARINASNPCSEYMYLDDSACNLASLNLRKFVGAEGSANAGEFDVESFRQAVATTIIGQEIIVGNAKYPTDRIRDNSHRFRPLGLGYANLGALLMSRGLPYDSAQARGYAGAITSIMTGWAYRTSAVIARDVTGPFDGYPENREPFIGVMKKHRREVDKIDAAAVPADMMDAARDAWDQTLSIGKEFGYRNGQATVLAPTGTIGFMMDCDTTGIEPDIALIKYKRLVGGGMIKIVNNTITEALAKLGYDEGQVKAIVEYIDTEETIEGAPGLKPEHLPVFDCAFRAANGTRSIHFQGHIRMMAAAQPFISGAISKTVNLPPECTIEDVQDAYMESWKQGLKAVAVYRDGCKRTQPLSTSKTDPGLGKCDGCGGGAAERAAGGGAQEAARRAAVADAQVLHRGPRGLHPRRPVRDRRAGRDLREDGQGGLDDLGPDGQLRDGDLAGVAARRAGAAAVRQVLAHALRALRLHREPGHPARELDHGLPVPVPGVEVREAGRAGARGRAVTRRRRGDPARRRGGGRRRFAEGRGRSTSSTPTAAPRPRNGHKNGGSTHTGNGNYSFIARTDAPTCPECGSIMIPNGSCHKCVNCGTTSGCS